MRPIFATTQLALMWYWMLTCFMITLSSVPSAAQSESISLNLEEVPVTTVLDEIKKQTTYRFSHSIDLNKILKERKVTIRATRESIEQILSTLFDDTEIAYKVVGNDVLLSKKNSEAEAMKSDKILTQIIKGKVVDKESKVPLVGVSVVLIGDTLRGTFSDVNGMFSFKVPIGRQSFEFSYVGYEESNALNILVISGKETFLNVEMRESIFNLNEVVVKADQQKGMPLNSMAAVSARQLTTDDASRYAAGYYDPARMVSAFAGVMTADDERNNIIVRGNSPLGLLWKLEGIEIPNPNHFNQGQGDGGGVFSIISSDALANSDFFTGAFPAEYGNATSGILDLNFRKGNPDKHEFGILIGMIGSQVTLEGPLAKNNKASYFVNYRYGNLQFLNELDLIGLDENQKPSVFQDLNFNMNFNTKKAGTFSLFGIGGISSTGTLSQKDSMAWRFNLDLQHGETEIHKMGVAGIRHTLTLRDHKTFLKTIVALTDTYDKREERSLNNNYEYEMKDNSEYSYPALRTAIILNTKSNSRNTIRAGLIYNQLFFKIYGKEFYNLIIRGDEGIQFVPVNEVYVDQKGRTGVAEAFFQWKHRLTDQFELNSGVHHTYLLLNKNYSLEPRLGLKWQASNKSSFSYGFGLHSKVEPISVYYANIMAADSTVSTANKTLELTKALHQVIGYDLSLREDLRLKVEAYYQYLYDVPVGANAANTYSRINDLFGIPNSNLQNKGKGYNIGIDLTLEKFYSDNYYFLVTGSVFDSKYKPANGQTYNTYFNTNYQANLLAGKDFKVGGNHQHIFSLNFKTLTHGGFRYTPEALAKTTNDIIYTYPITSETYEKQTPYYLRMDLGLKYRRNNPSYSWIISLDVQNITNRQNVITYNYMVAPNNRDELVPIAQTSIGIVPVLNFKVEF